MAVLAFLQLHENGGARWVDLALSTIFALHGGRMFLGACGLYFSGAWSVKKPDLARYRYQEVLRKKEGKSFPAWEMHLEIYFQCFFNQSLAAIPLALAVATSKAGPSSSPFADALGVAAWVGIAGWIISCEFVTSARFASRKDGELTTHLVDYIENVADMSKLKFAAKVRKMKKDGDMPRGERPVCDVGLWQISRHPNYFG